MNFGQPDLAETVQRPERRAARARRATWTHAPIPQQNQTAKWRLFLNVDVNSECTTRDQSRNRSKADLHDGENELAERFGLTTPTHQTPANGNKTVLLFSSFPGPHSKPHEPIHSTLHELTCTKERTSSPRDLETRPQSHAKPKRKRTTAKRRLLLNSLRCTAHAQP
jgi:hypothetical protein